MNSDCEIPRSRAARESSRSSFESSAMVRGVEGHPVDKRRDRVRLSRHDLVQPRIRKTYEGLPQAPVALVQPLEQIAPGGIAGRDGGKFSSGVRHHQRRTG